MSPPQGLSRDEREDLARYILRIKHELGIPIVWVEHDMQMVADLADRIYVLDHGEPIAEGAPAQVLSHPEVVRAYLGAGVARARSST
jgi:branched-chain amino acid transport system ATP-binding protein